MSSGAYDHYLTIFSPEGRLHQIEYAMQAVKSADLTALAVKGTDCVVLISQKKTDDPRMDNKLLDHSSVTRLFPITNKIGAVVVGSIADGRTVMSKARQEASEFYYNNGHNMPVKLLARRMADKSQSATQHAGARTMGVDAIFAAVDEESGPELYKTDPAGYFIGFKAVASGKLGQECNSILEKLVKDSTPNSESECVQTGIMALQEAAKVDFNSKNLEVGVINGFENFKTYTSEQIEKVLTDIAERD